LKKPPGGLGGLGVGSSAFYFCWVVICFLSAEAGASWFGIFIAEHATMPFADAKVIAERTATAVFVVSFAAMMISAVLQFRAREKLHRIESNRLLPAHAG
jgi:hypothetical protein